MVGKDTEMRSYSASKGLPLPIAEIWPFRSPRLSSALRQKATNFTCQILFVNSATAFRQLCDRLTAFFRLEFLLIILQKKLIPLHNMPTIVPQLNVKTFLFTSKEASLVLKDTEFQLMRMNVPNLPMIRQILFCSLTIVAEYRTMLTGLFRKYSIDFVDYALSGFVTHM